MSSDPSVTNELFARILEKIRSGKHLEAITMLDEHIDIAPKDSRALFLRGAEQAELRNFENAIIDFRVATKLDPELWTAHFELGLIFYLQNNYPQAMEAWSVLDKLPSSSSFRLFAHGLMLFTQNRHAMAVQYLEQGIRNNSENPALSESMQKILLILNTPAKSVSTATTPAQRPSEDARHVLLNSYDEFTDKRKS